ncbi:molecular chaperone [Pseudomonas sp. CDFA 602]|uniref:fimbrial biogenesis chaperone n=1 Tax=Pseudomonas californiensis TaxID=2829823 RepID=UPI001E404893|nr:molecular chaperone [Pseudomonas californiensis]MCD5993929.1 molecular chaperone [Pseudomonas californiensis]MCD5999568.1 molecular chaperone [Pseudomonas californiensis]
MTRLSLARTGGCLLSLILTSAGAEGALSLAGTRLIFDGRYTEVSIETHNKGSNAVLVQATLSDPRDDDDTPPDQRRLLPFVITPPLSKVPAGGKQLLRVLYQGAGMPAGQESLLHLYALEVPQRQALEQQLNIAVRQRINVFYRPPGLEGDPADSAERLRWTFNSPASGTRTLSVENPTVYHVSLEVVQLNGVQVIDYLLLAPRARLELPLAESHSTAQGHQLRFNALTDYGARRRYCAPWTEQASFTARLQDTTPIQDEC